MIYGQAQKEPLQTTLEQVQNLMQMQQTAAIIENNAQWEE